MAALYNSTQDWRIAVPDNSWLTWPSTGWTWAACLWVEPAGSRNLFDYWYSQGVSGGVNNFDLFIAGTGGPFTVDHLVINYGDASTFQQFVSNVPMPISQWFCVGTAYEPGVGTYGWLNDGGPAPGNGAVLGTSDPTGQMNLGGRSDGNIARRFNGRIAYVAKWSRILSPNEMYCLGNFMHPRFIPDSDFHMHLTDDSDRLFDEQGHMTGITEPAGTTIRHPHIISPAEFNESKPGGSSKSFTGFHVM